MLKLLNWLSQYLQGGAGGEDFTGEFGISDLEDEGVIFSYSQTGKAELPARPYRDSSGERPLSYGGTP